MIAEKLLTELESRGASFDVCGDRLRIKAPPGAVSADLLAELRARKFELIDFLTWPEECLAAEQEHGHRCARLFPMVGEHVNTPMGQGQLIEALPERAVVALGRRPERLVVLLPAEVAPLKAAPIGDISRSPVH